ncbi:MAG: DUF835 domain-containing protein [Thermoplasmata archaeon]
MSRSPTYPLAVSCLAMAVACLGFLPAGYAAADEYIDITLTFSPAKAQYYPGEDFSIDVTIVNLMPASEVPGDPLVNWVRVLNVSAYFSWMALGEAVLEDVSDTSSWLPPDQGGSETYTLDLAVPVSATARTYDYRIDVEYDVHTAWGNVTYSGSESYYGFVVSKSTGTSLTVAHDFLPDKASYSPGENLTFSLTVSNTLPAGVSEYDVFPCVVTNISTHFSWMAADEDVWDDLSDEVVWLSPDGTVSKTYCLDLTVPEDASESAQSYCFTIEYVEAAPWGEENRTSESQTYSDFVVSDSSGGVLGGIDGYVLYIALAAVALSAVALGAVLHHRRDSRIRAAALGVGGDGYPVLRPVPGEHLPLENGLIYLVKEMRPSTAFAMYNEAVSKGAEGMLVSREHPNRLREIYSFSAKSVIWLSRRPGDDQVDPTELSLVSLKITRFVEEHRRSVVLFEGLEYLITQNDFETVLRFVNHLHDFVLTLDCAVVIVIDPRVLSTRELALLERSARVVEPVEPVPEGPSEESEPPAERA